MSRLFLRPVSSLTVAAAFVCLAATSAPAQELISARAGLINHVSGGVFVNDGLSSKPATTGFQLEREFRLSTDESGRAELLLNPGSYFRLGYDSEITIIDNAPDRMRIGLERGHAIIEAGAFKPNEIELELVTSSGSVRIVKNGLYRIDQQTDGRAIVRVFSGEARVPTSTRLLQTCSKGTMAELGPAEGEVALDKFNTRELNDFDNWSTERAKILLAANEALSRTENPPSRVLTFSRFRDPFYDPFYDPWGYGFWGWSSFNNCYTFFPAPWYSFRSPYGGRFGCGCGGWFYPWLYRSYNGGGTYSYAPQPPRHRHPGRDDHASGFGGIGRRGDHETANDRDRGDHLGRGDHIGRGDRIDRGHDGGHGNHGGADRPVHVGGGGGGGGVPAHTGGGGGNPPPTGGSGGNHRKP